jgi:hypothetical protein
VELNYFVVVVVSDVGVRRFGKKGRTKLFDLSAIGERQTSNWESTDGWMDGYRE